MRSERCEILIVGAGPVGLFLALLLQHQGIGATVVERQKAAYPLPRAVLFDHESRRLFGSVNLSKQVEAVLESVVGAGGEHGTNFVWRDADLKLIVDLFTEAPTRSGFPSVQGFSQPELEGMLEKTVLERGIRLIRGYELLSLEQNPDRVRAAFVVPCREPRGTELQGVGNGVEETQSTVKGTTNGQRESGLEVEASFVVGCDGANSTVRRLQNFSVTDLNFENDWLIVDLVLQDGYVPPLVKKLGAAQICDPRRPTTTVWGGLGRKRFEFMRMPGESREHLLKDETLWELFARWGFRKNNCKVERKVIYTFKARWANEFFKDRVVLAGDALHLMPPFIGQGLNSGFRDASALAWRFSIILSGPTGHHSLLQSFQNERMGHIRKLTDDCILLGQVVCETDPVKSKQVHAALRRHPPGQTYDPPLGRPGVLASTSEAGRLSLQRPLSIGDGSEVALFDDIYGYGWRMIALDDVVRGTVSEHMSEKDLTFFFERLRGQCVSISSKRDVTREYRSWFTDCMSPDHVVIVRPDFYVFGHAAVEDLHELIDELREKIGYVDKVYQD